MIYSMTGYGRGVAENDGLTVITEIKATNHRFLDLKIHLNREYSFLEPDLRQQITPQIKRGHLDLTLSVNGSKKDCYQVIYNRELALELKKALEKFKADGLFAEMPLESMFRALNIFEVEKKGLIKNKYLTGLATRSLDQALESLLSMRIKEGLKIFEQLTAHLNNIERDLSRLIDLLPDESREYRQRLESRIENLLGDKTVIDEYRLIHEIAIMSEKADVTEETSRLGSHLDQLSGWIRSEGHKGVGKKLDFILQEINREINTIGSKTNHLEIARLVIELKNETEMIREQVQNVE